MAVSRIVAERLRRARMNFAAASYDGTNASVCSWHSGLEDRCDDLIENFGYGGEALQTAYRFRQRRAAMIVKLDAWDGSVECIMRGGGMMGDGNAPDEFVDNYSFSVSAWLMGAYNISKPMVAKQQVPLRAPRRQGLRAERVEAGDCVALHYQPGWTLLCRC